MSDQAMKLFEALSGVDEELLERCNRGEYGEIAYMPLWKYGKVMTACVCLLVAGALFFGGYRLLDGRKGSSGSDSGATASTAASSAPAQIQDMTIPIEPAAGVSDTEGEAASQITADTSKPLTEESLSGNSGTDNFQNSFSNGSLADKSEMQKEMASAYMDSRVEIPWDTACEAEPFGSYLPTAIPAGYRPSDARQSTMSDEWNNMIFTWENGDQTLCLNMTVREAKDNDAIKDELQRSDGLYQYPAEDFTREMIPQPIDGKIMFTLYYSDGMQIDFTGNITEDEMWELVKSIPK